MKLSPCEDLFLEVLAGRWRLGESMWTFESRHKHTADKLATMGLVGWKHGSVDKTIMAWLTVLGIEHATSPTYTSPKLKLEGRAHGHVDCFSAPHCFHGFDVT